MKIPCTLWVKELHSFIKQREKKVKKLNFSLITILAMNTFALAGGDRTPVEPIIDTPIMVEEIEKPFKISIGGYFVSHDESVSLTLSDILGTNIDFQKDLGFDKDSNAVRVVAEYRFNDLHKIKFSYYHINSDASALLTKDIVFDGDTYQAGASVSSHLNLDIYKINYGYTFYKTEALEIDLGLGIHAMDINTGISGKVSINGESKSDEVNRYTVLAPLPVVGLHMNYALTPKLDLYGSIDYFGMTIDKYSGSFSDFIIGGEYQVSDSFGLGLGFNMTDLDIEIDEDDEEYALDQKINGVFVYLSYSF